MAEIAIDTPPVSRRRIIERPRLTRLLDESPARIKMLVAPAGYGKTTLARQWLGTKRPSTWLQCGPQSGDVAALVTDLVASVRRVSPDVGERLAERLRSTELPANEIDVLTEILLEEIEDWPAHAWLVVDDYQYIADSSSAELLFAGLSSMPNLNLLVCGRCRPTWATGRRVVYGEILALEKQDLELTRGEGRELLGSASSHADAVLDISRGWPAVVSLATFVDDERWQSTSVSTSMHEFLADEIYVSLSSAARDGLSLLAVAPNLSPTLTRAILGEDADAIVAEGVAAGMADLRKEPPCVEIHPLIREFLLTKFKNHKPRDVARGAERVLAVLTQAGQWDDAFAVVRQFLPHRIDQLTRAALPDLLAKSRTTTLEGWTAFAVARSDPGIAVRFAMAELAFRAGAFVDALASAELLLKEATSNDADDFRTRVLLLAGRSAHLASREQAAMDAYGEARRTARNSELRKLAGWGEIGAAIDLELPNAAELLEAMENGLNDHQDWINLANKRLILDTRTGALRNLARARAVELSVDRVRDPLMRCSFRNGLASTLALAGEYQEGLRVCNELAADAQRNRLEFVVSYALATRGLCLAGLRRDDEALDVLAVAKGLARRQRDSHSELNCDAIEARLHFARGRFTRAAASLRTPTDGSLPSMASEVEATRALAYAGLGRTDEAIVLARRARELSTAIETRVLVAGVSALCALRSDPAATPAAVEQFVAEAIDSGNLDCFACVYRGVPEIFSYATTETLLRVAPILSGLGDFELAMVVTRLSRLDAVGVGSLSPREAEVGELVARGYTNKQIGAALFITTSTAKLHVHHIFEKLGVQTRTAAALRLAAPRGVQAAPNITSDAD